MPDIHSQMYNTVNVMVKIRHLFGLPANYCLPKKEDPVVPGLRAVVLEWVSPIIPAIIPT